MSGNLSRRQVVRGSAALMAGLLVGCQREQPPGTRETAERTVRRPTIVTREAPSGGEPTLDDLQRLLDGRAQALRAGDEQAFLAPLDQSNQELIQHERMVFANLRQLEFTNLGSLTERAYAARPAGNAEGRYVFSPVIRVAQLVVDEAPGGVAPAASFQYEVATRDGELVVTDIVGITRAVAEQAGIDPGVYANAPWNTTPLKVLHVGRVWLASDGSVPDLERYAAAAEAELRSVEALWGDRARFPGHFLFFSRDENNLKTWFDLGTGANGDIRYFEGWQIPLRGVRSNGQVYDGQNAGSRIVVNLASTERWEDDPRMVVRHELAHAVTAQATVTYGAHVRSYGAPRWALEGFARWVEYLDDPDRKARQRAFVAGGVRAGLFTGMPPRSDQWHSTNIGFNYAVSATLFSFIEQTRDTETAVEFYARVIQHDDSAIIPESTGRPTTVVDIWLNPISEEVLGTDGASFLGQWAAFVRKGA